MTTPEQWLVLIRQTRLYAIEVLDADNRNEALETALEMLCNSDDPDEDLVSEEERISYRRWPYERPDTPYIRRQEKDSWDGKP